MSRATMVMCAALIAGVAGAQSVQDGYVGRYQVTPTSVLTVSRDGDHLFTQLGLDSPVEIFPESAKTYVYKAGATAVVLRQNGQTPRATRVE